MGNLRQNHKTILQLQLRTKASLHCLPFFSSWEDGIALSIYFNNNRSYLRFGKYKNYNYHPLTADALSMLITISTVIGHGSETPLLRFCTRDSHPSMFINLSSAVVSYGQLSPQVCIQYHIDDVYDHRSPIKNFSLWEDCHQRSSLDRWLYIFQIGLGSFHVIQWPLFKTDKGPVPCKLPLKSNWSQRNWPTIKWSRSVTQFYRLIWAARPNSFNILGPQ